MHKVSRSCYGLVHLLSWSNSSIKTFNQKFSILKFNIRIRLPEILCTIQCAVREAANILTSSTKLLSHACISLLALEGRRRVAIAKTSCGINKYSQKYNELETKKNFSDSRIGKSLLGCKSNTSHTGIKNFLLLFSTTTTCWLPTNNINLLATHKE